MPTTVPTAAPTIALVGNPNTGKSTVFTALAGVSQRVGNYPGVTVEKRSGWLHLGDSRYEVIDLPGLYSLAARSRDEMVAADVLMGREPGMGPVAAVICVVDAANLRRNLYLLGQVLGMGLPVVVALNMVDIAENRGVEIDVDRLQRQLGVPVVPTQAHRRIGLEPLKSAVDSVIGKPLVARESPFPEPFREEVTRLEAHLAVAETPRSGSPLPRPLVERLLLDVSGYVEQALLANPNGRLAEHLCAARGRLADAGCGVPGVETSARYAWIDGVLDGVIHEPERYQTTASDRIDRLLTHGLWGTIVFAAVMFVMFQAVFRWAEPLMEGIESGVGGAGAWIEARMAEGALRSLLVEGVIGGVGGVLVFLPQILILFLFIALLEECGYMARAAYLMDGLMVRVGLSGRSFIPLLSCFACAVPGIMATRVIENERDRLTTILVAPLMTCSARLPVYALLIAAFIPPTAYLGGLIGLQGLVLAGLYLLGIVTAVVVAVVLKKTFLRGETPPFLLELPSYKWPSPRVVAQRVFERGVLFLRCAGTIILAVSIVVWASLYFPHNREQVEVPHQARIEQLETQRSELAPDDPGAAAIDAELAAIDRRIAGDYQRQSLLGRMGQVIEPAVRPLGWDWRIGCATLASFPAREIVVATLGVIFNVGEEADEESGHLRAKLESATWEGEPDRKLFTVPVALSVMVFFALCAQCAPTLAVIRRETNSVRWPLFAFTYMTALAYLGALVTYQVGTWIAG